MTAADVEDGVRTLFLALDVDGDGAHPAARQAAERPATAALIPQAVRAVVATAQDAGFALATFADGPLPAGTGPESAGRLEAGTRAAFVSAVTDRIGLAPTLHATLTEPFHLATQLAALDHAGHGRAAWIVGAANSAAERATIGAQPLAPDALRSETIDVIGAARALWDSWEDDAVIKDVATGRYLDSAKVHHVDFVGTPSQIADTWTHYVRTRAVDGFNIVPYLLPGSLVDIVDKLVPELQERGVYRTEYQGSTLREHLSLPPVDAVREQAFATSSS